MFISSPKIYAHLSVLEKGNFVVSEYILNKGNGINVNLFRRFCPHRLYPLADTGTHVNEITCKLHNFKWDKDGEALNNSKKIHCGEASIGKSGLIFKNFIEPNHKWVNDLAREKNLKYSHSLQGSSPGSWLWLMDIEADLLHVYLGGIHPFLSKQINLDNLILDQGDGWVLQTHPSGWWLYIFPYVFIEYENPGCVMINYVTPKDDISEFGYDWTMQFYYDDSVRVERRLIFETSKDVYFQDIEASEKQKGKYFPLLKSMNRYEDHCVYFGNWFKENKV